MVASVFLPQFIDMDIELFGTLLFLGYFALLIGFYLSSRAHSKDIEDLTASLKVCENKCDVVMKELLELKYR